MVKLYLHSPIRLCGVVLNLLSTQTTLPLLIYFYHYELIFTFYLFMIKMVRPRTAVRKVMCFFPRNERDYCHVRSSHVKIRDKYEMVKHNTNLSIVISQKDTVTSCINRIHQHNIIIAIKQSERE
jgi:hypothetical protein